MLDVLGKLEKGLGGLICSASYVSVFLACGHGDRFHITDDL